MDRILPSNGASTHDRGGARDTTLSTRARTYRLGASEVFRRCATKYGEAATREAFLRAGIRHPEGGGAPITNIQRDLIRGEVRFITCEREGEPQAKARTAASAPSHGAANRKADLAPTGGGQVYKLDAHELFQRCAKKYGVAATSAAFARAEVPLADKGLRITVEQRNTIGEAIRPIEYKMRLERLRAERDQLRSQAQAERQAQLRQEAAEAIRPDLLAHCSKITGKSQDEYAARDVHIEEFAHLSQGGCTLHFVHKCWHELIKDLDGSVFGAAYDLSSHINEYADAIFQIRRTRPSGPDLISLMPRSSLLSSSLLADAALAHSRRAALQELCDKNTVVRAIVTDEQYHDAFYFANTKLSLLGIFDYLSKMLPNEYELDAACLTDPKFYCNLHIRFEMVRPYEQPFAMYYATIETLRPYIKVKSPLNAPTMASTLLENIPADLMGPIGDYLRAAKEAELGLHWDRKPLAAVEARVIPAFMQIGMPANLARHIGSYARAQTEMALGLPSDQN